MDIMTFSVSPTTALAKRVFDLGCAMVGIALTLPLFPIIALAIKLNSHGMSFTHKSA